MTETASAAPRAGWGAAVALSFAVLFLSVLNALPLVVLPLAVLLVALPSERRGKQAALGALLAVIVLAVPGGAFTDLSRGWGFGLAGAFLTATMLRPRWSIFARSLASVAGVLLFAAIILLVTGKAATFDVAVRDHFATAAGAALESFGNAGGGTLPDQWREAMRRVAEMQWLLFPAILVLESIAALVLASWWAARIRAEDPGLAPRGITRFRFADELVWILIIGLVLAIAPFGDAAARVGYNAITVMAGLYAVRGLGVFLFLVGGAPSVLTVVFALLVGVFLYPLALAATVMMGLADTWLDVRGRAAAAPRS